MERNKTTKLTLETADGVVSIEVNKIDLTVTEMFDEMLIPLLLGATYQKGSIARYLGVDEKDV